MARAMARSLRRVEPELPIALATDAASSAREPLGDFDSVVTIDPANGPGVLQKLYLDRYTPFRETLFIDSDCLVFHPLTRMIEWFRAHGSFAVAAQGEVRPGKKFYGSDDVERTLSFYGVDSFAAFNSGVLYFRKDVAARAIFDEARSLLPVDPNSALRRLKDAPVSDEPLFAIAMRRLGCAALPDPDRTVMGTAIGPVARLARIDTLQGRSGFVKKGRSIQPLVIHFNVHAQHCCIYQREISRVLSGTGPGARRHLVDAIAAARWLLATARRRLVRGIVRAAQLRRAGTSGPWFVLGHSRAER